MNIIHRFCPCWWSAIVWGQLSDSAPWVGTGVKVPAPMWSQAQREVTSSDVPNPHPCPWLVWELHYPACLLSGHQTKSPSFSLMVHHHKLNPRISVAIAPNLLWLACTALVLRSSDGLALPLECQLNGLGPSLAMSFPLLRNSCRKNTQLPKKLNWGVKEGALYRQ